MNIKPSSPQGPGNPADAAALESARTAETRKAEAGRPKKADDSEQNRNRADSANVSAEAKALAERSEIRATKSALEPGRLQEISERLESGFYDRPEVIDQVARRLANDADFLGQG